MKSSILKQQDNGIFRRFGPTLRESNPLIVTPCPNTEWDEGSYKRTLFRISVIQNKVRPGKIPYITLNYNAKAPFRSSPYRPFL